MEVRIAQIEPECREQVALRFCKTESVFRPRVGEFLPLQLLWGFSLKGRKTPQIRPTIDPWRQLHVNLRTSRNPFRVSLNLGRLREACLAALASGAF